MLDSLVIVYYFDSIASGEWNMRIKNDLTFIDMELETFDFNAFQTLTGTALTLQDIRKVIVKDYTMPVGQRIFTIKEPF